MGLLNCGKENLELLVATSPPIGNEAKQKKGELRDRERQIPAAITKDPNALQPWDQVHQPEPVRSSDFPDPHLMFPDKIQKI